MKKSFFRLCAAFAVALLSACGGGGDAFTETSQPVASLPSWNNAPVAGSSAPAEARAFASAVPKKLASVSSDPFGGVGADEAGRQMFLFARANYGVYFPSDQPKLRYQCFDYSYYPETDRYLGLVVLDGCAGYSLGEVYIMGSVWGNSPSFVARLIDIVPIVPATKVVQWYNPPLNVTITLEGTKVFGANQLPSGCTSWQQQCWKDAVANGTVKWVASGGTSAGRPVVFAYFRNTNNVFGNGGLWNHLPFYADTGEPASQDINGGVGTEVEWLVGNAVGAILRSGGQCFEHYNAGSTWSNRSVTCP